MPKKGISKIQRTNGYPHRSQTQVKGRVNICIPKEFQDEIWNPGKKLSVTEFRKISQEIGKMVRSRYLVNSLIDYCGILSYNNENSLIFKT